LEKLHK